MLELAIALALLIGVLLGMLGGCETVKGVGKDIEKAGESIQKAAQ